MPKRCSPRHGSMQFWPRVRAKRPYARIRSWSNSDKPGFLAFPCYKAGMTFLIGIDSKKTSETKNEERRYPVTVLEAPPLKIFSVRFYKKPYYAQKIFFEMTLKSDKNILRKIPLQKKIHDLKKLDEMNPEEFSNITITVHTQPKLIDLKKKPEIFEMHLAGTNKEKIELIKKFLNKDISLKDVFEEGEFIDIHGITKGKGIQGPVKRFGVNLRSHKAEKTKRGPGSLGGWRGQGHVMYRVAHAGQTGYQQRTEYNKQILKISNEPKEINPAGGFLNYGLIKENYLLLNGSAFGTPKRLLILTKSIRNKEREPVPTIQYVSISSRQ